MEGFVNKKLGDLEVNRTLRRINKDDLLVSYDFNSVYPIAQADNDSTWHATETAFPLKNL